MYKKFIEVVKIVNRIDLFKIGIFTVFKHEEISYKQEVQHGNMQIFP